MATYCRDCATEIDEASELNAERQPCPSCGSKRRVYEEFMLSTVTIGTQLRTKGYTKEKSRTKGLKFETVDGDSFSTSLKRFVKVNQLVDHEAHRYKKLVVDTLTGDVLRDVDKPLSEHQNRGTAKIKPK